MNISTRVHLIEAIEAGYEPSYLFFWGHSTNGDELTRACLSQWYAADFEVDGLAYNSAEQFMMARKAELFGDEEHLAAILESQSPPEAKALGRKVRGFDADVWAEARFDIVVDGNIAKFGADPDLSAFLIATGDKVLVEAAPRDTIWGIGLGAGNEKAQDPRTWRGENLLGFALMQARSRLDL